MALSVVHIDDEGAACASGVLASPWWNVEVPYTPIGCIVERKSILSLNVLNRNTHLAGIALALLKHTRVVVGGHVPRTAHLVVDMLAQRGRVGAVLARTDAELLRRHEIRPFVDLRRLAVERAREDETADGVAYATAQCHKNL